MRNPNRLVKYAVLAAAALALWACSNSNGGAPAFNAQGSHPAGWLQLHPLNYLNNPDQCKECHSTPTDPSGGISRVSCASASWKGVGCHAGGPGHPAGFANPDEHGARAKAKAENSSGFSYCQVCHGQNFTGGNIVPGFTTPSCVDGSCHGGVGWPHSPPPWLDIDPASPAPYRSHTTTDESNANVCFQCHGSVVTSTPGCFNNTMCHGPMNCIDCHGNGSSPDAEVFAGQFWNSGTPGLIQIQGEWDTTGHGRPSNTNYTSGNPGAGFDIIAKGCEYCHDPSIRHRQAANPFRLRNIADETWGMNGVCMNCHASGSEGVTVAGVQKNSTRKVGAYHFGEAHTTTLNGGQFCWDCHDGHGDNNIFMIHRNVAPTSDATTGAPTSQVAVSFTAFATGTDFAKSVAPFDGICNVCHTPGLVDHYTNASGDGHHAGTRCTICHNHNGNSKNTAFKPPS